MRDSRLEVSVIVRFQVAGAAPAAGPGVKPELKPLARGSQGEVNADCTTVWLVPTASNTKVITEPCVALKDWGVNPSLLLPLPSVPT